MTKHYRQRLVAVIALSFLSFTSPLLLTRNAAAENLSTSNPNMRRDVAYALERIALSLQEKAKTLTQPELNQAVSNLESALKIVAEPKADFSQATIANLRAYLNIVKAEQRERLFVC